MSFPRPIIRIGCITHSFGREWQQYCSVCPLKEEPMTKEAFEAKCEGLREQTNATDIWNVARSSIPVRLKSESRQFLNEMKKIKFTGDMGDYAKKLNDLTTKNISEDEALELAKTGDGKLVCDIEVADP